MDGLRTEWAYDANGNRSHENGLPIASYDAQDRLLAWKDNQYTYTPAGDLLTRTSPQGQTRYQYDAQGNLRQVLLPGGQRIDYDIDPLNRRIGKRKNGQVQYRLLFLDKLHPLAEFDQQGNIRSLFVYADRSNAPTLMLRGGKTWRLIADHLGSIRLVIDAETGQIGQRIDYDAWGRVTHDSQPGFQPFGFAGGLYDPDTGLTRFGARDYDAETGRWTAKDPILFDGGDSNLYGYVLQDPVNFVDPEGKEISIDGDLHPYVNNLLTNSRTFQENYDIIKNDKNYHLKIKNFLHRNDIDGGIFVVNVIGIDTGDIRKGLEYYCSDGQWRDMTIERAIAHEFAHAVNRKHWFNSESKAINFENKIMGELGNTHDRENENLRWKR
ncbi:RHS repeat domain-containing protein [Vandammella animalimorsus]|uniref:Teneurin-like YD-shell domain-containing protein n=1 Tax=Vandammella animalimorsus TaxID=2029117 RepID=A0A2A2AMY8_9BURK|nr:RHS repeat-associated core domain-containing protein [Vandammella animalimorsus]PAT39091.1 hypothetical protein CK621_14970 [Vandammella animalimorsus]